MNVIKKWILGNCHYAAAEIRSASIVVLRRDDGDWKVLIGTRKNDPAKGEFSLPGGRIKNGEDPHNGACRELREETGINVHSLSKISRHVRDNEKVEYLFGVVVDESKVEGESDLLEPRWVSIKTMPVLAFNHSEAVHKALGKLEKQEKVASKNKGDGLLVVFEGPDGSGKSTNCDRLIEWLEDHDYPVTSTKWNSGEMMKDAIDGAKERRELSPMLYFLTHSADMIWRYEQVIEPALKKGRIVVCDRYLYTSLIRDSLRGIDKKLINEVYAELRQPDVIFHCCIKPEIAYARLLEEKGLPYYGSGMDMDLAESRAESCLKYEQMMTKAYDDALPHNMGYFRLDTNRPEKEIFKDVKREISRRLGE